MFDKWKDVEIDNAMSVQLTLTQFSFWRALSYISYVTYVIQTDRNMKQEAIASINITYI